MLSLSASAWKDVLERVLRTFVGTFLGLYIPAVTGADHLKMLVNMSIADKAATAAVMAVVALVIGLVGTKVASPDDASMLNK